MRVCVLTPDLGTVSRRKAALLKIASDVAGCPSPDVCFVGYRESHPLPEANTGFVPYGQDGLAARAANQLFRLIDGTTWVPTVAASIGLSVCAPTLVEVLLACDPDAIVLDVRWAGRLTARLQQEFPGSIHAAHGDSATKCAGRPDWRRYDPSAAVSIVLPTHNGSRYIRQSIQSCLDQSHSNIELIVVDDGSHEDMRAIVEAFDDRRIRFVRHENNRGISAALNTGFALSSGTYLTWTSDDNYYAADAVARMVQFLQSYPQVDFVYSSSYVVDEMEPVQRPRMVRPKPPEHLKVENGVGACFLYTRRVYEQVGGYDSATFLVEDYDYWVRVSKQFRMQRVLTPFYYYRYHKDSLTAKHTREDVAFRLSRVKRANQVA